MKVLILGAAGRAGREVAARVARLRGVSRLYLADRDAEALCRVASDLSGSPSSPRFLDVGDEDCLMERVREADVVMGCTGPSHLHEERIARTALMAGRDYITLCDEPEATLALRRLGPEAGKKGVRILCGAGLTPGISNLLACRAAAFMDEVRAVSIAWCLLLSPDLGAATMAHLLHACGGKAPVWRAGRGSGERCGGWPRAEHFPPPLGWRQVSHLAHPEPFSLPAALPGVREVDFRAGFGEAGTDLFMHALAWLCDGAEEAWLKREILRNAASALAGRRRGGPLSAVIARAEGMSEGAPRTRVLAVAGDYYGLTAAMAAAALEEWIAGPDWAGTLFPEQALDHPAFFSRLAAGGVRILLGEAGGGGREKGTIAPLSA
ncbi:MAG: saccharopine dehydrogenase NADP-binding domain-containing protein [Actinobacteria bacterium]|nr:saccharopine dehydrogenase NADP-binding domain-containing protein [Actinomycetota bacterium]